MENKNEMMVFNNEEFGKVRVVNIDGECWLVGKDVVEALGYNKKYYDVIKRHCDEEDYILIDSKTQLKYKTNFDYKQLGQRGGYLVNDKGLFSLIFYSSNLAKEKRKRLIEWFQLICFLNDGITLYSRKEIEFLDKLENALIPFSITGIKQYNVLNYRIDYYIPSLNVAIEYDENAHKDYTYEQHELRQKFIEEELGCKFIRVIDKNNDDYNIGLVIKQLLKYGLLEVV